MFEQLVHESSLGWVLPKRPTNFATQLNLFPASHPIDQSSNLMPLLDLEEERRSTEQTRFKLGIGVGKVQLARPQRFHQLHELIVGSDWNWMNR